jgi:hypothetical protein
MAALPKSAKSFTFMLRVPAAEADEVAGLLAKHAEFMRTTHSLDGSKGPQVLHYNITRQDEFVHILDPSKGTTGNVLFALTEVYASAEGIGQHLELCQVHDMMAPLEVIVKYGAGLVFGGDVIESM